MLRVGYLIATFCEKLPNLIYSIIQLQPVFTKMLIFCLKKLEWNLLAVFHTTH